MFSHLETEVRCPKVGDGGRILSRPRGAEQKSPLQSGLIEAGEYGELPQ